MTKKHQALGLLILFCVILVLIRIQITESTNYTFLLWNIFLAFIPYFLSEWMKKTSFTKPKIIILISIWLLFLPNAPYIITDLIHLHNYPPKYIWYNLFMIFSFAFAGLSLAIISMYDVYRIIKKNWSTFTAYSFIVLASFLSGFGIYLGRFLRLNSWDVFTNPLYTLKQISASLSQNIAWFVSLGFGSLLWVLFSVYKTLQTSEEKNK